MSRPSCLLWSGESSPFPLRPHPAAWSRTDSFPERRRGVHGEVGGGGGAEQLGKFRTMGGLYYAIKLVRAEWSWSPPAPALQCSVAPRSDKDSRRDSATQWVAMWRSGCFRTQPPARAARPGRGQGEGGGTLPRDVTPLNQLGGAAVQQGRVWECLGRRHPPPPLGEARRPPRRTCPPIHRPGDDVMTLEEGHHHIGMHRRNSSVHGAAPSASPGLPKGSPKGLPLAKVPGLCRECTDIARTCGHCRSGLVSGRGP